MMCAESFPYLKLRPADEPSVQLRAKMPLSFSFLNDVRAQQLIGKAQEWLRKAASDGVCPDLRGVIMGIDYGYGVGCAWEDELKGAKCRCPSMLDVCATTPRFAKLSELELVEKYSLQELGYCRTGAWVFFLPLVLAACLCGVAAVLRRKR